jgi:hypothetical protein
LQSQLPAAGDLSIRSDRSVAIRRSVNDVKFTLLLTVCLVVLVIFLFLRNVSATAIPSLALPFSIIGTFAVMWVLNFSLDNLSLMALTLSVGFVVDDAIVMLENIVRHMEMGKPRMEAALDGSKEIAFTIVSMTLSLAAVFIPILFMGGIVGRLMHPALAGCQKIGSGRWKCRWMRARDTTLVLWLQERASPALIDIMRAVSPAFDGLAEIEADLWFVGRAPDRNRHDGDVVVTEQPVDDPEKKRLHAGRQLRQLRVEADGAAKIERF